MPHSSIVWKSQEQDGRQMGYLVGVKLFTDCTPCKRLHGKRIKQATSAKHLSVCLYLQNTERQRGREKDRDLISFGSFPQGL